LANRGQLPFESPRDVPRRTEFIFPETKGFFNMDIYQDFFRVSGVGEGKSSLNPYSSALLNCSTIFGFFPFIAVNKSGIISSLTGHTFEIRVFLGDPIRGQI
jgi:hypothetical protein